jgi:hypothetical protein
LEQCHSAVQDLYAAQLAKGGLVDKNSKLLTCPNYSFVYKTSMNLIDEKGVRSASQRDPQVP